MNNEALKKLRGRTIVNVGDRNYPYLGPSLNTPELHIEIYKLVGEYVSLYEDREKINTGSVKGMITKRMDEIERTLLHFWIVEDNKLVPREKK